MLKILLNLILASVIIWPFCGRTEAQIQKPAQVSAAGKDSTATITWRNPEDEGFAKIFLFRSPFLIEDYFTFEAVSGLCDKLYEGTDESFVDAGLAVNLPYYYVLFSQDKTGNFSLATVVEKKAEISSPSAGNAISQKTVSLSGASADIVNQVSKNEAGLVFNYNKNTKGEPDENSRRLSLFIIVKSPHSLNANDKNAISFFISEGTPTTIVLGSGERAGVLNSYLSVFDKLPRNELEWQDIIKIANGRWPDQRNAVSEQEAADVHFSAIYRREANMDDPNDNAAVTVIAYGLRPSARNLENEKKAIEIYRSIFNRAPAEAVDWDLVRAIAYSGASR